MRRFDVDVFNLGTFLYLPNPTSVTKLTNCVVQNFKLCTKILIGRQLPTSTTFEMSFLKYTKNCVKCILVTSNHKSSKCYKTFFGGNLENLDFPQAVTAIIGHFKCNKWFWSIVLLKNSIVLTFLFGFRHWNKLF